jgi:hypothetical protein
MKSTSARVVYTAVFGNYDRVPPVNPEWDCDFICFTDNPGLVSPGWQVVTVHLNNESPAQANRRYKMLPHKYLSAYESSLYVDGNIKLVADPSPLFGKYLRNSVVAIPRHQERNCAYVEASLCIERGLVSKEITEHQMARYAADGFPRKFGMTENGIILRKHDDEDVRAMMASWWDEYCGGGRRDQLSLPYLIWKKKVAVNLMEETARNNNKYFRITLHTVVRRSSLVGRVVDYIACNRYRSNFYKMTHKVIHEIGKIKLARKIAR